MSETAQKTNEEKNARANELVERVKNKDMTAIEEFFEIFSDDIYNFPVRYYNFSEDEAGDLYLYAFEHLKDGKKLSSFKGKSKFTTWFHSVLRNLTIDFLRTQKEKIRTTTFVRLDSRGNLVDAVENISDTSNKSSFEEELFETFVSQLKSLKFPQRVLFKLAYIHYIDLDNEELEWLAKENGLSEPEILDKIMHLKEVALKKEGDVRTVEDKLTANFQQISAIQERIENYFKDNPHLDADRDSWSDDYQNTAFAVQICELIQSLVKKKRKHTNLLTQQQKGLLSVRVPYKEIAELLNSSKGVLSVQLLRTIEKLNQAMENTAP